ncbi:MAG: hypothetical protein JEZ00_06195 [Anaerolineaceae bacterium]|nr:hypothetical protein [Anaerolineaceae bacterium]
MKKIQSVKWISILILLTIIGTSLASCANDPAAPIVEEAVASSDVAPTENLCTGDSKITETRRLNRYMIRFDDISVLAQATPREQLAEIILEMQRIRQDAAFEEVQPCFSNLQSTQVNFMNGVIITMTNFLSGVSATILEERINETRELRTQYDAELASLLGMTYITSTPAPTIVQADDTPTFTAAPVRAFGVQDSYILNGPGDTFTAVDTFLTGQEANIISRSADGMWVKISRAQPSEITGWVSVQFISIEGDANQLPVE